MELALALQYAEQIKDPAVRDEIDQIIQAIQGWASESASPQAWSKIELPDLRFYVIGTGNTLTFRKDTGYFKYLRSGPKMDIQFLLLLTTTGTAQQAIIDLPEDFVIPDVSFAHAFMDNGTGVYRDMIVTVVPANYGTQPRNRAVMTIERSDGVALDATTIAAFGQFCVEIALGIGV